jgi:hypothetical protein
MDAVSALLEPAEEAAPNKKHKATEAPAAQVDEISLSIASMDGTSVPLRLPRRSRIGEVKQAVGTVSECRCALRTLLLQTAALSVGSRATSPPAHSSCS